MCSGNGSIIKKKNTVITFLHTHSNFYAIVVPQKYKDQLFGFPILREKLVLIMMIFAHIIVTSTKVAVIYISDKIKLG